MNPKLKKDSLAKDLRSAFETSYALLNTHQKEAVDTIEGPVMVVAGPGTGKTQVLTLRIANIIKRVDINPGNVLALTFTENAASSMKRRLAGIIGPEAYSTSIYTFHGFANELISQNPDVFESLLGAKPANDADRISIISRGLKKLKLTEISPLGSPGHYIKDIISSIESLKREGVLPSMFNEIVLKEEKSFGLIDDLYHERGRYKGKMKGEYITLEKQIKRNKELALMYEYYSEEMRKAKLYDYSDMILEVMRSMSENKLFLQILQERYQYILVDEHQDTNRAQNKIIELLCSFDDKPNLFIVGDEKQAIYRFQGASLENFEYFKSIFPSAKIIFLENNYRSHQGILDSADSVIPSIKKLKSHQDVDRKISVVACENFEAEGYNLATSIKADIDNGVKPEEIAVLYRDNKDSLMVAQALANAGIPFSIESDKNVLEDREVYKLITLLKYLVNSGDESLLAQVLHFDFLDLPTIDAYQIILAAHRGNGLIKILSAKESIENLNLSSGLLAFDIFQKLSKWSSLALNDFILDSFNLIVNESGYVRKLISKNDSFESLEKFRKIFDEVRKMAEHNPQATILDFVEYLKLIDDHGLSIRKGGSIKSGRVRCMTAHSSKGLEFDHVYIVQCNDKHWGNRRDMSLIKLPSAIYLISGKSVPLDNEDERRLFYVAMTRARNNLTISYSKFNLDGRDILPAQFISEIKPELYDFSEFESSRVSYLDSNIANNSGDDLKDLIKTIFLNQGISVTALNNYLKCPWHYFYVNLIRIPAPLEPQMMYGTAVHEALDDFLKSDNRTKEFLIERFRMHMESQPMSRKELWRWIEKGEKALSGYFDFQIKNWKNNSVTELNIRDIYLSPEIKINGKIDKIEILNDRKEVNVVDYKTGKPKTRNDIKGNTKSSSGDIFRQLSFYKILLDKYRDGKEYKMVSAQVDFIEPDKNKYGSEIFEITNEDKDKLILEIERVAKEIINFEFKDRYCEDQACPYCTLRKMTV